MVVLTVENYGEIRLELDYESAPNTAKNFAYLVSQGYYDGLIFHRIIKGFMIQGGDPTGTGMGGPGYSIRGEFRQNGFDNPLSHRRGVISMARSQLPDSAGSQFFICDADDLFLDGQYAAFGKVVAGLDVVDAIAATPTGRNDRPLKPVRILKAELVDEKAEEPERIK